MSDTHSVGRWQEQENKDNVDTFCYVLRRIDIFGEMQYIMPI